MPVKFKKLRLRLQVMCLKTKIQADDLSVMRIKL
jgi:hypothetical protein